MMTHRINPMVDCVLKKVLGAKENKNLLIHFLNAVLNHSPEIRGVEILSPYNEKEFETDELTVVDVKAEDESGKQYQIEVQLSVCKSLPERMLYGWSSLYQSTL
ncbi:MAG: Rpn family recombination-promoting nuclease/putative transposase [Proteobacteria bacterium]|nr:Rpn family recombination-promoting nuclease/putative transposase [Pseudomonadota bacterium]